MNTLPFIAVPLQRGRGQFMLTPLPFSQCLLGFRDLVNPPNISQRRNAIAVMAVISTIPQSCLERLQSILPI